MHAVAVVLAAGAGERTQAGEPKAFLDLGGTTMLEMSVAAAVGCPEIDEVVVTAPSELEDRARRLLEGTAKEVRVVAGGSTRQESVRTAMASVPDHAEIVAVHDAARCFASSELFSEVVGALGDADGAVPVVPVRDTVKRLRGSHVVGTVPREELASAQTPQAFRTSALRRAHERAAADGITATDDAALLERAGFRVVSVPGEESNFKVTTASDLERARALVGGKNDG